MSENTQSPTKRQKIDHKQNFYMKKSRKQYLESGHRGFLATCNFREKDCIRECYNILNQYADELYGPSSSTQPEEASFDKEAEVDISDDLEKNIQNLKTEAKKRDFRFQVVDTGTANCIFITTTLDDPVELGQKIVSDIASTKVRRTRHLLRLVPIDTVCRANLKDIMDHAGTLFDKHFLKEPKTYSIVFNKRYNNSIKRDEIINVLANMVAEKNNQNKVDLTGASVSIIVEIIKGLCCLSVVRNYLLHKKYNLAELVAKSDEDKKDNENKNREEEHVDDKKKEEEHVDDKKKEEEHVDSTEREEKDEEAVNE